MTEDLAPQLQQESLKRPAPPDLEFRAPDCPMCGEETTFDSESFWCENCSAYWSSNGSRGEWADPDEPG